MSELTDLVRLVNRLQADFDNLVKPEIGGIWTDWTPTVDQNGAVAATVTYARYTVLANVVHMIALLAVTGTGTAANAIIIQGIPSTIAPTNTNANSVIGIGMVREEGVASHVGALLAVGANNFRIRSDGNLANVGSVPSFAIDSGDAISFQATYER